MFMLFMELTRFFCVVMVDRSDQREKKEKRSDHVTDRNIITTYMRRRNGGGNDRMTRYSLTSRRMLHLPDLMEQVVPCLRQPIVFLGDKISWILSSLGRVSRVNKNSSALPLIQ